MSIKSRCNKEDLFSVATFNVRGLRNHVKQEDLSRDVDKHKIDICSLKETKITEHFDKTTPHGNRLRTIPSNSQHYGNGFILNKKWKNSIHAYWKISDRLCVLQLKTDKSKNRNSPDKNLIDHIITIINVYGRITERATQHLEELRDLHNDLTTLSNDLKNLSTSMILIAGDFNRKVGKADEFETCSYRKMDPRS